MCVCVCVCVCVCCLVPKLCPTLLQPQGLYIAGQAPLSTGFPRRDYWNGFPFPFPGNLPGPRI